MALPQNSKPGLFVCEMWRTACLFLEVVWNEGGSRSLQNSETGEKLRVLLVDFEMWRSWGPTFLQALPLPAFYAHTLWRLSPDPHCIGGQLPKKDAGIWQISSGMWVQQLSQKNLHTLKFLWRSKWIPNIEMIQSLLGMWMDYEGANGCWSPTFAHTSPSAPTWLCFVST